MNTQQVGKCSIEVKSKSSYSIAEILFNVLTLNFIALLFISAIFGG